MTKRRLPIGIQTFCKIREENCYYVDKTAYIRELLDDGTHFFLSRPRRFGKSLFLDTLKELFEGNEPLFEGLHIHDHWDWSVRYAVLRFDFSSGNYQGPDDLRKEVAVQLDALENEVKVSPRDENASARLRHLMKVRKDFGLGVGSDRLLIRNSTRSICALTTSGYLSLDAPTLIGVQFASTSSAHAEKHFHIHNDKGIL